MSDARPPDWHIFRASWRLVSDTMHVPAPVPCDLLNQLLLDHRRSADHHLPAPGQECPGANEFVASLFIAIFSVGVAIGSVAINRLLKSEVSARYAPASVLAMAAFVIMLDFVSNSWAGHSNGELITLAIFFTTECASACHRATWYFGDRGHVLSCRFMRS